MYKLQANFLHLGDKEMIPNGILVVDHWGEIREIAHQGQYPSEELTVYEGILCPGFVNTHCHLELSFMRGMVPEKTGLLDFISHVIPSREAVTEEEQLLAIAEADQEMYKNGIVAVGDISNTETSFAIKARRRIYYHNFIELLSFSPQNVDKVISEGVLLLVEVPNGFGASFAPHAPYSVSPELMQEINTYNAQRGRRQSIHNQECAAENEFFQKGTGAFAELYQKLGIDISHFTPPQCNSLEFALAQFDKEYQTVPTLLIHNTYTTAEDIEKAEAIHDELYWCFCPNANLYIEDRLPNFQLFRDANVRITVGTDSLASNHQLCILSELKTIQQADPTIPLEELLTWATWNGSNALGTHYEFGRMELGKRPGILLIEDVDIENMLLKANSSVSRLF